MVNLRKKRNISRNEWPRIMSKYDSGRSIAQIGRDYGCTAPAIRYIIKRVGMLKGDGSGKGPLSERKTSPSPTSRSPTSRSKSGTSAGLLRPELCARVTGDVVSVLAALDRVVLEGSIGSLTALQ